MKAKYAQFYSLRDYFRNFNPYPISLCQGSLNHYERKNVTHIASFCVWCALHCDGPFLTTFKDDDVMHFNKRLKVQPSY